MHNSGRNEILLLLRVSQSGLLLNVVDIEGMLDKVVGRRLLTSAATATAASRRCWRRQQLVHEGDVGDGQPQRLDS